MYRTAKGEEIFVIDCLQTTGCDIDFHLSPYPGSMVVVGIWVGTIPLLSNDPYDAGKTTITGEELRRMP